MKKKLHLFSLSHTWDSLSRSSSSAIGHPNPPRKIYKNSINISSSVPGISPHVIANPQTLCPHEKCPREWKAILTLNLKRRTVSTDRGEATFPHPLGHSDLALDPCKPDRPALRHLLTIACFELAVCNRIAYTINIAGGGDSPTRMSSMSPGLNSVPCAALQASSSAKEMACVSTGS